MSEFKIAGNKDFILVKLVEVLGFPDRTTHWGGYDAIADIEMSVGNLSANSKFYLSTGNIFTFYEELKECYEKLSGKAIFESYEKNLNFEVIFELTGKIRIAGNFIENHHSQNELKFELQSDQSYLPQTLLQLSKIVRQYGNQKGISNAC